LFESTAVDAVDFQILNLLRENGRASYASIGSEVGLSAHGAADRIRRLERRGAIIGYTALIDLEHVGRSLDALIDVRLLPTTDHEQFEAQVEELPAVREVLFLTGRFDYQLRVACRDADDLDATVRSIRRHGGAAHTETRIAMRSRTYDRRVGEA